jgi:hypothetical protein
VTGYVYVYAALIATGPMVVALSVIGLDLPQPLVNSLLLGVAVALAVIGVVILVGSIADASTQWPRGFDAKRAGEVLR